MSLSPDFLKDITTLDNKLLIQHDTNWVAINGIVVIV